MSGLFRGKDSETAQKEIDSKESERMAKIIQERVSFNHKFKLDPSGLSEWQKTYEDIKSTHQANVQARKGELLRKWRANDLKIQKPSPSPARDQLPSVNFKKKLVEYSNKIRDQNKLDYLLQEKHNQSSSIIGITIPGPSVSRLRSKSNRTERGRYKPTVPLKPLKEQQKKMIGQQY
jgi:hypothetical protein